MASSSGVVATSGLDCFTQEEVEQFHQQGFLVCRGIGGDSIRQRMLNVTMEGLHRAIEPLEYEADVHYPGAPDTRDAEGGRTVRRLQQALSRDIVFLEWIESPSIKNRLHQLLGEQIYCPLAHHNCIMTKEPKYSSDTGWHQDIRYWSFTQPELVSVWLALGKENLENGCLQVIPGSHRESYPPESFDGAKFFRADYEGNQSVLQRRQTVELAPGDVLFFHAKTLHSATRNRTNETKYSVVFTFRGEGNSPLPGTRSGMSSEVLIH